MHIEHTQKYQPERASMLTFLCAVARNAVLNRFRRNVYESEDDFEEQELYLIKDETVPDPLFSFFGTKNNCVIQWLIYSKTAVSY